MKQGLTAATLGSPPIDFLGKKLGFVVLARANELFNFPASGLVASVRTIKEKPDQIKRVIKAGIKASRYIRQNREGTLPVMVEWLKIDKEIAAVTYDSVGKLLPKTEVCRKMACGWRSRKQSASARSSVKCRSTKLPISRFFGRRKESWGLP